MTSDDSIRLADLEHRLKLLESERDIRDTIERYGCAVDAGSGMEAAGTFVEEGVYDSDFGHLRTRRHIEEFIDAPHRVERRHRTAHLVGPLLVRIEDDMTRAVVVGYSVVLSRSDDGPSLDRVGINRWTMTQRDGRWLVATRTLRPVGHPEAADLLRLVTRSSLE
jgi:hypothetical protein